MRNPNDAQNDIDELRGEIEDLRRRHEALENTVKKLQRDMEADVRAVKHTAEEAERIARRASRS